MLRSWLRHSDPAGLARTAPALAESPRLLIVWPLAGLQRPFRFCSFLVFCVFVFFCVCVFFPREELNPKISLKPEKSQLRAMPSEGRKRELPEPEGNLRLKAVKGGRLGSDQRRCASQGIPRGDFPLGQTVRRGDSQLQKSLTSKDSRKRAAHVGVFLQTDPILPVLFHFSVHGMNIATDRKRSVICIGTIIGLLGAPNFPGLAGCE